MEYWRRMPPAVFPSVFGLVGLGLVWQRAGDLAGFGPGPSLSILAVAAAVFLWAFLGTLSKTLRRPATLWEDLGTVPGRLGLATMSLAVMGLAAGMVQFGAPIARFLVVLGLLTHSGVLVLVILRLRGLSPENRRITPAWHLTFVGFIVGCLALVPLGHSTLGSAIMIGTFFLALGIFLACGEQIWGADTPAPVRPLMVIHLAPLSLFSITALSLGLPTVAVILGGLAAILAAVLLIRARWIVAAGFSPFWAAFTFPVAAFTAAMLGLSSVFAPFQWLGWAGAVFVTLTTPVIALRILRMAWSGQLAERTNAAAA